MTDDPAATPAPDSSELGRLRELTTELIGPELTGKELAEGLPDALVVVSDTGRVVIFNEQAELLFGYHRLEVLGHSVDMLVPDGVRHKHEAHRAAFSAQPRTRPMGIGLVLSGRHKSGTEFGVEINLRPIVTPRGVLTAAIIRRKA